MPSNPDELVSKVELAESPVEMPEGYLFISILGEGASGKVVRAVQVETDRQCVVKFLHVEHVADLVSVERFKREAQLLSTVSHENLPQVLSFGLMKDSQPYIVSSFVEGENLSDWLRNNKPASVAALAEILGGIADAIAYLAGSGLVHRDLKPQNIIVRKNDDGICQAVLIDFGLATLSEGGEIQEKQKLTRTGTIMGTPAYMSPEQCSGKKVDSRSDVYSLGCIVFECLAGAPPFSGESAVEIMLKHMSDLPRIPAGKEQCFSRGLEELVMAMLSKNPDERPLPGEELTSGLVKGINKCNLTASPAGRGLGPKLNVVALVSILLVVAGSGLLISRQLPGTKEASTVQDDLYSATTLLKDTYDRFNKTNRLGELSAYAGAQRTFVETSRIAELEKRRRVPRREILYCAYYLEGVALDTMARLDQKSAQQLTQSSINAMLEALEQCRHNGKEDLEASVVYMAMAKTIRLTNPERGRSYVLKALDVLNRYHGKEQSLDPDRLRIGEGLPGMPNTEKDVGYAYYMLGQIEEQVRNYKMAESYYEQAMRVLNCDEGIIETDYIDSATGRMRMLSMQGKESKALKAFQDLSKRVHDDSQRGDRLSICLARLIPVALEKQKLDQADEFGEEAVKAHWKYGSNPFVDDVCASLARLAERLKSENRLDRARYFEDQIAGIRKDSNRK